ncbi:hypothetical protein ACFLUJ_05345 [Chloroflexota bacterium]
MSWKGTKVKIALKYCGSCNPSVDLTRIARHLARLAGEWKDLELVSLSDTGIDVVVILCGCPRACGDKDEVRAKAKQHLTIAGKMIGWDPVPEKYLPVSVEKELNRILS